MIVFRPSIHIVVRRIRPPKHDTTKSGGQLRYVLVEQLCDLGRTQIEGRVISAVGRGSEANDYVWLTLDIVLHHPFRPIIKSPLCHVAWIHKGRIDARPCRAIFGAVELDKEMIEFRLGDHAVDISIGQDTLWSTGQLVLFVGIGVHALSQSLRKSRVASPCDQFTVWTSTFDIQIESVHHGITERTRDIFAGLGAENLPQFVCQRHC